VKWLVLTRNRSQERAGASSDEFGLQRLHSDSTVGGRRRRSESKYAPLRQSRFSDGLPTADVRPPSRNLPKRHVDSHRHVMRGSGKQARVFSMPTVQLVLTTLSPPFQDTLRSMAAHILPNEIWLYTFELATVEYLPSGELPNSMDRSAWFKNVFDAWCLQSPDELVMNAQKKRYKTVKVCCTSLVGAWGDSN